MKSSGAVAFDLSLGGCTSLWKPEKGGRGEGILKGGCSINIIETRELKLCLGMLQSVHTLGPTEQRSPQWPGPYHRSEPKSGCTYKKFTVKETYTNHNPIAGFPQPRKRDLLALTGDPDLLGNRALCPVASLFSGL